MRKVLLIECDYQLHSRHISGFRQSVGEKLIGTELEGALIVVLPQGYRAIVSNPVDASKTLSAMLAETDCRGHMASMKPAIEEYLSEFHAERDRNTGAVRGGEKHGPPRPVDAGTGAVSTATDDDGTARPTNGVGVPDAADVPEPV